jgi:hypothetical protein
MRKTPLLKALPCSLVVVSMLTMLNHLLMFKLFFFLLYPGLAISLVMTGGHGGTELEDKVASVVGFLVNVLIYMVLFSAIFSIQPAVKKKALS